MKKYLMLIALLVVAIASCDNDQSAPEAMLQGQGVSTRGQQQNAYIYVFWKTTLANTYSKFEQKVQVSQKAAASFWASSFAFNNNAAGAYIGLQTDGSRVDGTVGDTAIFSIWNATAATGSCMPFGGEGIGYSCRIAYNISTTSKYRLRVAKGTVAADGQWWDAYIRNESTYAETKIGSIKAPTGCTSLQLPNNFSEYFGPEVPTVNDVPVSIATWYPASLLPINSYLSVVPVFDSYTIGDGTGGSVLSTTILFSKVVKITLGGVKY